MRTAALLLLCAAAVADTLVDRGGRVLQGSVEIGETQARVGRKKVAIEDVFLVEKEDGTLVFAPSFEKRMRGYHAIARDHLRDGYLRVTRAALATKDYDLARRALEMAEACGLTGSEAGKHKRRLEKASDAGKPSDRVRAEFAELNGYYGELLVERAAQGLGTEDGPRLLREALRQAPTSKKGRELLARIAPKDFPIGDARTWLDWQIDLVGSGARIVPEDAKPVAESRRVWRRDVHGIRADSILMITPVKDSRVIGRALAYGRMSTNALAELFKADKPARDASAPLRVLLFESREEYMQNTGTGRPQADPASLEWTAGHYSPSEGISRFFWFADVDAERRIAGTCMHELTHHWLQEHNPCVARDGSDIATPGMWIVEGFATFMEEGIFDIDAGRWTLFNPRARSLDMVRALPSRELVGWKHFYRLSHADFFRLRRDNEVIVQGRWWLQPSVMSTTRIFYEQAGASCHYLFHAENGKYGAKLIEYVNAYYRGEAKQLAIRDAFGMSDEELGARVVKFAQAVADGWQPRVSEPVAGRER